MLNNITWQGYWATLALLSAGYYLVIYLLYYRNDFTVPFKGHKDLVKSPTASHAINTFLKEQVQPTLFDDDEGEDDFATPSPGSEEGMVYACMDELSAYFESSKRSKIVKQELLYGLEKILSKHPTLKSSEFKESLSKVIVSEAEHTCSIRLNEEDVDRVWLNV